MTEIRPEKRQLFLRVILSVFALLIAAGPAMAQTRTVTGTVKDGAGKPVVGATVSVKGTSKAVATGANGQYSIAVPSTGTVSLEFVYVGLETRSFELKADQKTLDISMVENVKVIEDVVVIGYGVVQRRSDLTGSVSSISDKVLTQAPVASTAQAMAGRMAGVNVTAAEGSPDAEIKIRVRGGGSITQDNSPLYIVDGFPVSSISDVSPSDIKTIDVLKDASSTALYGARGANGVVVITTKSGQAGKTQVSLNAYVGVKSLARTLDVLDPYEYVLWQYELTRGLASTVPTFEKYYGSFHDMDLYKSKHGTDWQDKVFGRDALQQNYNLSVSGGEGKTKYNIGLTHTDQEGIMITSGYTRDNITAKIGSNIGKYITFDFNARWALTKIDGAGVSNTGSNSRLKNAIKYAPVEGLVSFDPSTDDDDSSNPSIYYNPVDVAGDDYKFQEQRQQTYNAAINIKPWKTITIRSEWGAEWNNNRSDRYYGPMTSQSRNRAGAVIAQVQTLAGERLRNTNTLTWNPKEFICSGHELTAMVGQEAISYGYKRLNLESTFNSQTSIKQSFAMMGLGTPSPTTSYISPDDNMLSFFGRVNYSGLGRYLLTLTLRADGSSKFAPGHQWGYFPSAAIAWRISEERFMAPAAEWLSDLKLRLSYGAAGNNRIADNLWQTLYTDVMPSNQNMKYYFIDNQAQAFLNIDPAKGAANNNLKWETTVTRNVGLDVGLFGNRLKATADVYWNTTKNLLLADRIPSQSGYTTQMRNVGQTSNRGLEITLDGTIVSTKDFNLNGSFNIAFNRNKVDKLADGQQSFTTSTYWYSSGRYPDADFLIERGRPTGQIYGYVYDGMYTVADFEDYAASGNAWVLKSTSPNNIGIAAQPFLAPGMLKFRKIGDDGSNVISSTNDRTVIGNTNPLHTGGFTLNATWKGFDASVFLNWSYGNDVYNANRLEFSGYPETKLYGNILNDFNSGKRFSYVDRETGEFLFSGAGNDQRLLSQNAGATIFSPLISGTVPVHSWAVEDGSFLRLNTVTVGYTFPKEWTKKISIQNLRIYATGYNLAIWTNYSGYDPEVDAFSSNPLTPGVDYSAYPRARTFVGGINITF